MRTIWRELQSGWTIAAAALLVVEFLFVHAFFGDQLSAYETGRKVEVTVGECSFTRKSNHWRCQASWPVDGKTQEGTLYGAGDAPLGDSASAWVHGDSAYVDPPPRLARLLSDAAPYCIAIGLPLLVLSVGTRLFGRKQRAWAQTRPVPDRISTVAVEHGLGPHKGIWRANRRLVYVYADGLIDAKGSRRLVLPWRDIDDIHSEVTVDRKGPIARRYDVSTKARRFRFGDAPDLQRIRSAVEAGVGPGRVTRGHWSRT